MLFNKVIYCVCHDVYNGFMMECNAGVSGCNGWFHPDCVDYSPLNRTELEKCDETVCPLCTIYLQGSKQILSYKNRNVK